VEALWLHAINRKQYPRFFRGRYRLGMSLEMIANPGFGTLEKKDADKLAESLSILDQCGVTGGASPCRAGLAAPLSREAEKGIADGRKGRAARMPAATDPPAPHMGNIPAP
jgi:hypothetical protein